MKNLFAALFALILISGGTLLSGQVPAAVQGIIYASAGGNGGGQLFTLNPATGARTLVGNTAQGAIVGLAASPTGELLGTAAITGPNPWVLVHIDPTNGNTTVRGTFATASNDPYHALEFDAAGDFYGASRRFGNIVRLNPANGAVLSTLVSNSGLSFSGMARHPTNGLLYLSTIFGTVHTFDPVTGQLQAGSLATNVVSVSDLFFDPAGNLYLVQGGGATTPSVYSVNLGTGAATVVGSQNGALAAATQFLPSAPVQPTVPTLSQWGLILLGLTFLCGGVIVLWRRREGGRGSLLTK